MPWHIVPNSSQCPASKPWAVVLNSTGKAVGCHATKGAAQAHLAALNINATAKEDKMGKRQQFVETTPVSTVPAIPTTLAGAAVVRGFRPPEDPDPDDDADRENDTIQDGLEEARWDGTAAMRKCKTAGDFRSIAFELANDSDPATQAHWALPHHATPHGPADSGGVSAALGRLNQTGATVMSKESIRNHLTRHQGASKSSALDLPTESLYRGIWPADLKLREVADGFPGPVMFGHFAVFDQWTRIESIFEGDFMERLAMGAFAKTFVERRDSIRSLFQHGRDPQIGSKVLGPIAELREEPKGAYYEVPLLDTSYNRDLLPGLDKGLYGASFRFRVMREEIVEEPKRSDHNPDGLPERTIKEVELHEFGPVTFPAYEGATAGIRSLTDEFVLGTYVRDRKRLREILRYLEGPEKGDADRAPVPVPVTSSAAGDADRELVTSSQVRDYLSTKEEGPSWIL